MKNILLSSLILLSLSCSFSLPIDSNDRSSPSTFSIYVSKDGTEGQFLFKEESKYRIPNTIVHTLEADSNWRSKFSKTITVGGCKPIPVNADIVFDFNSDIIGFPTDVFRDVIQSLRESNNVQCSDQLERPTCRYEGKIEELPTIFFEGSLAIPHWVYVDDKHYEETGMITLNLKEEKDQSLIVLGRQLMSYYYTVFQRSSGQNQITLYTANHENNMWLYILFGFSGLALIVGVIYWRYTRENKKGNANSVRTNDAQIPLVMEQRRGTDTPSLISFNDRE